MCRPIEWWGASRARRRGKPETSLTRRKGVVKVHLISARRGVVGLDYNITYLIRTIP